MMTAITRRRALAAAASAAGGAVLTGVRPRPAGAYPHAFRNNSRHSIVELEQLNFVDRVNDVHTHFDGAHGDYIIDFDHKFMRTAAGKTTNGWLVFRELDAQNFYQLRLQGPGILFERKLAGALVRTGAASWPTAFNVVRSVRLTMISNTMRVYDRHRSLTAPVLTYTDPDNEYPTGGSVAYYTARGNDACWENVIARGAV